MANIFEFLSKDGNITPEKARKSRQMPFHDKTAYVWMGMLPLNSVQRVPEPDPIPGISFATRPDPIHF